MRETFAGMRGVSAALEERIQKVRTAVRNVMVERQIKQEEVTAEMIQDQLTFTNKIETIKALMEFSTTRNSYESMLDENDDIEGDLDVKTEVPYLYKSQSYLVKGKLILRWLLPA